MDPLLEHKLIGAMAVAAATLMLLVDTRRRMTRNVLSHSGLAVGALLLFVLYFGFHTLFNEVLPRLSLGVEDSLDPLWDRGLILIGVLVAAGYTAGRVAGHDREWTGLTTGLCFTIYAVVMQYLVVMQRIHPYFNVAGPGFAYDPIQPVVDAPLWAWWGGLLSSPNPLGRLLSFVEPVSAAERRRQKKAEARAGYKLVLLNDDRTPMAFVLDVLQRFFDMDPAAATAAMLYVHNDGRAITAVYDDSDAAARKLAELTAFIAGAQQPLRCVMETSKS